MTGPQTTERKAASRSEQDESTAGLRSVLGALGGTIGKVLSSAAALASVLGLLLAMGVIHGSDPVSPSVAQAAASTIDAGSARVTLTQSGRRPDGSNGVLYTASGAIDFRLNRGSFTYDYSSLYAASGGHAPTSAQAIIDSGSMYVKSTHRLAGKSWFEVDLGRYFDALVGVDIGPLLVYNSSPRQSLQSLEKNGTLRRIHAEVLDGVQTTHYRGVIDLRKVAADAPPNVRAGVMHSVNSLIAAGAPTHELVDVWVGFDDLVRQIESQVTIGGSTTSMQFQFYDFGAPVNATPPPADQVKADTPRQFVVDYRKAEVG